jgi:hypothetical protein
MILQPRMGLALQPLEEHPREPGLTHPWLTRQQNDATFTMFFLSPGTQKQVQLLLWSKSPLEAEGPHLDIVLGRTHEIRRDGLWIFVSEPAGPAHGPADPGHHPCDRIC